MLRRVGLTMQFVGATLSYVALASRFAGWPPDNGIALTSMLTGAGLLISGAALRTEGLSSTHRLLIGAAVVIVVGGAGIACLDFSERRVVREIRIENESLSALPYVSVDGPDGPIAEARDIPAYSSRTLRVRVDVGDDVRYVVFWNRCTTFSGFVPGNAGHGTTWFLHVRGNDPPVLIEGEDPFLSFQWLEPAPN